RKFVESFARRWVFRAKCSRSMCRPPAAGDQNRLSHLTLNDRVEQRSDAVDLDFDNVAGFEREAAIGNDAGSSEQESASGERIVPAEPADEVFEGASHLLDAGARVENDFS